MRIFHPLCALVLAAAAPAALLAQDSAPSGAAPTTTAAAKKEPVKKKPVKRAGPPAKEVRTFGTMTGELLRLAAWLTEQGVTHVALESTGVYWSMP